MTSAVLEPFRGLRSENSEIFMTKFSLWLKTQNIHSEIAKICHLALLLRDQAQTWHEGLNIVELAEDAQPAQGEIGTFEAYRQAFLNRFRREEGANWREVASLFALKQGPSESTETYVTRVQNCGVKARATPDEINLAMMSGLRPALKNVLAHHQIDTVQDVIRWAALAEDISEDKTGADDDVKGAMQRIEAMLAKTMVNAAEKAKPDTRYEQQWDDYGEKTVGSEFEATAKSVSLQGER